MHKRGYRLLSVRVASPHALCMCNCAGGFVKSEQNMLCGRTSRASLLQPCNCQGCRWLQVTPLHCCPAQSLPLIASAQIDIDYSNDSDYWIISIRCRDRAKLLFDTGEAPQAAGWLAGWSVGCWLGVGAAG